MMSRSTIKRKIKCERERILKKLKGFEGEEKNNETENNIEESEFFNYEEIPQTSVVRNSDYVSEETKTVHEKLIDWYLILKISLCQKVWRDF